MINLCACMGCMVINKGYFRDSTQTYCSPSNSIRRLRCVWYVFYNVLPTSTSVALYSPYNAPVKSLNPRTPFSVVLGKLVVSSPNFETPVSQKWRFCFISVPATSFINGELHHHLSIGIFFPGCTFPGPWPFLFLGRANAEMT